MSNDPKTTPKGEAIDKSLDDHENPESLAEATTAPLDDDALGGHANQGGVEK